MMAICALLALFPVFGQGPAPVPEDLGPSVIDVSAYPPEHQKTYKEIFVPFFSRFGGTARIINSPLVSAQDWKKEVDAIRRRPACCGACPVLSLREAKALWSFLVYDSAARKTGPRAQAWARQRQDLLDRYRRLHT